MNLQTCRVVLRPRGPLESFDLGFRLVQAWWRPLLGLSIAVLGPAWAACLVLGLLTGWHWAVALVPIALGPALQAPFTLMGGRLLFDESVRLADVAADLRARIWPFWLGGLGFLAAGLAATILTCGMAGVPAMVGLVFIPECALLERVAPRRGLRRSLRLSGGSRGGSITGAIGRWALLGWCAVVAETGGQALVGYVLQAHLPVPSALEGHASPWILAGILLSHPLWAIWRLMLYVDARTRVEGWDLQVGLRAAGLAR